MAQDTKLLICLTTTVVNHRSSGEEKYKYTSLPITNENLEFIKALQQISDGKLNLTDVSVCVSKPISEETDGSSEETGTSND